MKATVVFQVEQLFFAFCFPVEFPVFFSPFPLSFFILLAGISALLSLQYRCCLFIPPDFLFCLFVRFTSALWTNNSTAGARRFRVRVSGRLRVSNNAKSSFSFTSESCLRLSTRCLSISLSFLFFFLCVCSFFFFQVLLVFLFLFVCFHICAVLYSQSLFCAPT